MSKAFRSHDEFCNIYSPCAEFEASKNVPHLLDVTKKGCVNCATACSCALLAKVRQDELAKAIATVESVKERYIAAGCEPKPGIDYPIHALEEAIWAIEKTKTNEIEPSLALAQALSA